VLTEAATNIFACTAVIARSAGARVLAIARDSPYGTTGEAQNAVRHLAQICGTGDIEFVSKDSSTIELADIVTNLGFVRPIDAAFVAAMKQESVISYMCEAWEFRPGDVDLDACRLRGIPVVTVNESASMINIFSQVGILAVKMILNLGLEIYSNRILVYSPDDFGPPIAGVLKNLGAEVWLRTSPMEPFPGALDLVLIADYKNQAPLLCPSHLEYSPDVKVLQFCGGVNYASLVEKGIRVFPESPLQAYRMAATLAYLGPRPVIDLHTAGLKAGQVAWECRTQNRDYDQVRREYSVCGIRLV